MMWYPQIGAGSVTQFPLQRSRKWRAISNNLESGERILLPDAAAGQIEWQLPYQDLTDDEIQKLRDLFTASQGRFGAFTFIDPLANLLGWSEDLTRPDWQAGLLQTQGNISDPLGTHRAWAVSNGTTGAQTLAQTIGVSGDYTACFSAWVRSGVTGTVALQRDGSQTAALVGPAWKRVFVTGTGTTGALQSTFSIEIAAGQTIDIWGLQAEAQPHPSAYKQTVAALGIYEETYFGTDELKTTSDGVGLSSTAITLTSRV
jgi:hypothetical protein